ncbi:MAG: hypothetical protein C0623_05055 [Desulfuromonas sp.]|nr:MAG: hypothetical protein C0623_05055 [Desulfuromonas sp.]
MRFIIVLFFLLNLAGCAANKPQVPISEDARLAEAAELVRYSLTSRIIASVRETNSSQMNSFLAGRQIPPELAGPIVAEEIDLIIADEEQRLLDHLVPIYRRYYTPEEIHQLLTFYRTDVARKSQQVSEQIAGESLPYFRAWTAQFSERLLERVYQRLNEKGIDVEAGKGEAGNGN